MQLAGGNVSGRQRGTKLLAAHCLYIGLVAKARMQFTLAIEWLQQAKGLAKIDGTADIPRVQLELIDTIKQVMALFPPFPANL